MCQGRVLWDPAHQTFAPLGHAGLRWIPSADTIAVVEAKIHAHIQHVNATQSQRATRAESRHPETLRPRARPEQDSIVEPYRALVIREVQRGGNHRTLHPLLQQQGFTGSANTVYQYILKLRREIPEALHPVAVTPPADLQLQQTVRDTVYKAVLKRATRVRQRQTPNRRRPLPSQRRRLPANRGAGRRSAPTPGL